MILLIELVLGSSCRRRACWRVWLITSIRIVGRSRRIIICGVSISSSCYHLRSSLLACHNNSVSSTASPVVTRAGRGQAADAQCDDENNEGDEHKTADHYTGNLSSSQTVSCVWDHMITPLIILNIRPHKVNYLFLVQLSFKNWPGDQGFYILKLQLQYTV